MLSSVIVVLMLLSCTCGENPAIQVVLNNKGLQYGKHAAAGWIQEKLEHITLPDIPGKVKIIFGTIDYTLTGVTILKCDFPEPSVEFLQDVPGFKASISGLSIALKGGWQTRFGIIHDGGTFNMAIFNVDVASVVHLGKDADGHPSVATNSCNAEIGNVDITFHGGASWIINPFVSHFKGRIRNEIQEKICPAVTESIESFENHLKAMNVSFDVDQVLSLDLPLTSEPVIEASSLNLGLKGEFYSIKTHKEPPFESQPFTMPEQPGYMLSVGMSDFTLNTASYGYYSADLLHVLITDSMIPPCSPVHLNTSSMGKFIPQLSKLFPDLLMNLMVYAKEAPEFTFKPNALTVDIKVIVKASAIAPNATQIPLFTLDVDSEFSSKLLIDGGSVKGSVTMNNLTLTLVASEVGSFKTDGLQNLAKMGVELILVKVQAILKNGIILPRLKHAQLVNSVLKMEEGFIAVFSDVEVFLTHRIFN